MMRAIGVFLFVTPLIPILSILGPTLGADALVPLTEWALGGAVFGAAAWVLALFGPRADDVFGAFDRLARRVSVRTALVAGLVLLGGLLVAVGWHAFRHRPHLIDSIAQLFQARAFALGKMAVPSPELPAFFASQHLVIDAGGWYAQYPPGHAALLAVGVIAGATWIVPVVLSLGSFTLLTLFTRRIYGRETALLTAFLLVLCPFFWFMGASHMNHVSALFFIAAFLYAFARWEDEGRAAWAVLGGAALAAAFLSRPWDAIAIGAPFALFGVGVARRRRAFAAAAGGVAAFLALASLYLAFNAATTGDPLLTGYVKLWGESHGLGFHVSPWGEAHTPATGLRNEIVDLSLLNVFLFEWPIPALWPVALFLLTGRDQGPWDRRLAVGFLALPVAYFFYWHRDAFLGPRFLYAGIAFIVPLTARALLVGARCLRRHSFGLPGVLKPVDGGVFVVALAALCFVYAVGYTIPQRFRVYATGLQSMKVDLVAEARGVGIDRGVVFVATSWGDRMLARLHGAGVSAALAEQVYRQADHCELETVIERGEHWPAERLENALRELLVGPPAPRLGPGINGDTTLRLVPGRELAPACLEEIRYDRLGFTIYAPHLLDNRTPPGAPLIVARDLRSRNGELGARHPDLPAYLYRPGGFVPWSAPSSAAAVEMPPLSTEDRRGVSRLRRSAPVEGDPRSPSE